MRRDGLTAIDAIASVEDTLSVVDALLEEGNPMEAEEYFCGELDLDADHIEIYFLQ